MFPARSSARVLSKTLVPARGTQSGEELTALWVGPIPERGDADRGEDAGGRGEGAAADARGGRHLLGEVHVFLDGAGRGVHEHAVRVVPEVLRGGGQA